MLEDALCSSEGSYVQNDNSPKDAPATSDKFIDFEEGIPTKSTNLEDGTVNTDQLDLCRYCFEIAGKHAIGPNDIIELPRPALWVSGVVVSTKRRVELFLREASLDLESFCMAHEDMRIAEGLLAE